MFSAVPAQTTAHAQPAPQAQTPTQVPGAAQDLKVVTRILPPMVVPQRDGQLTGFSIDLWDKIAERLQIKSAYQIAPDVRALLEEIRTGSAEVGFSAISITAAREKDFDFSQSMLNAGLQIMVRGKGQDVDTNPLWDLLRLLFSKTILVWLGIALLLILIPAHIVWLLERGHKDGMIPTRNCFPGIFYAMFWAAGTLATQGERCRGSGSRVRSRCCGCSLACWAV
jgi:polar amino acid transport system substrate-binding protein